MTDEMAQEPFFEDPPPHGNANRPSRLLPHRQRAIDLAKANPGRWVKAESNASSYPTRVYKRHGLTVRLVKVSADNRQDVYVRADG